jgi:hypothetical protein
MNEDNQYMEKWRDAILKASEAFSKNDFDEFDRDMQIANEIYEEYKNTVSLTYECVNFGMSNYIFEDVLPTVFKKNKKALKEFIKTIKEDRNLKSQAQFYKALEKCGKDGDVKGYINESLELLHKNVGTAKELKESNKKLADVVKKYKLRPSDFISEENLSFFNACDYLFKNEKKLTNLDKINENVDILVSHVKNSKQNVSEGKKNVFNLIGEFEKKYKNSLNEDERDFVKTIIDAKASANESKQSGLFNKLKSECLNSINKLIDESKDESEREGLNSLKSQIEERVFCKETLVQDVAKLLEIRDIINS